MLAAGLFEKNKGSAGVAIIFRGRTTGAQVKNGRRISGESPEAKKYNPTGSVSDGGGFPRLFSGVLWS